MPGKFYDKKIDTDNPIIYDKYLQLYHINNKIRKKKLNHIEDFMLDIQDKVSIGKLQIKSGMIIEFNYRDQNKKTSRPSG